MRLFNGASLALAKRGHVGHLDEYHDELKASAIVGDTQVSIDLELVSNSTGASRAAASAPGRLRLSIGKRYGMADMHAWEDDFEGKLEAKTGVIAAAIIRHGEAAFREGLREDEERRLEQIDREAEAERLRLAAANAKRVDDLKESAELLRQADAMRALVRELKAAMAGQADAADVMAWDHWAMPKPTSSTQ